MERYLGAKIKELRQSRNWTQAYLAERLNKSVSTVSGYESDAHPVPTDVLISIAELFGISLDALLGLERRFTWSRKTNGRLHAGTVSFADKNC